MWARSALTAWGNMKRSAQIAILAGSGVVVGVFFLTEERAIDAYAYATVDACVAARTFSRDACQRSFDTAAQSAQVVAPKYVRQSECEADFGLGACAAPQETANSSSGGGSSGGASYVGHLFSPRHSGFIMEQGGAEKGRAAAQPLYRMARGGYFTAAGDFVTQQAGGKVAMKPSQLGAPRVATRTTSRGGFGSSTARFRGFGG